MDLRLNVKKKNRSVSERIKDLSIPEPNSGCWLWLGNYYTDGYPQIQVRGKPMRVNRVSLILKGINLTNKLACHKCDIPACVNPDHLFAGTQSDNINDSVKKGRQVGNAKLTQNERQSILKLRHCPTKQLTKLFNVSKYTINRIKRGK